MFHDPCGARSIYYRIDGPFAVGSHPELLAHAVGAGWDADVMALVKTNSFNNMSVHYLPGDVTLFDRVCALTPNQYYDIGARCVIRYWPRRARGTATFEEFFAALDFYFQALVDFLRPPRRPIASITGGIDSRTLLAAFRRYGVNFRAVTWTSFNIKPWESGPVSEIARYLRVPFGQVNRSNSAINAAARIGARSSGNFRGPAPNVAGMFRLYGDDPSAIFVRGLGAEVIRGFYNTKENPIRDYSAGEMFRAFLRGQKNQSQPLDAAFERTARLAFERFYVRTGYDQIERFGFDINDLFYWEHRVGTWATASLNAMDPALDSLIGFNSRWVFEVAYGLPDKERLTKQLFIAVIERYDPRLAAIEYR